MVEDPAEDCPGYGVVDGAHSWLVEPGKRIYLDLPLTGWQVLALSRNPALLRACSVQGSFSLEWLLARLDSIAVVADSGKTVH